MSGTAELLCSLTDEQLAAVTAGGPIVHLSACAGSGKTRTIAARMAWLIEGGADPSSICCLSFTRAACSEIRSRVCAQVGPVADQVRISTFHERALVDSLPLGGKQVASEAEVAAAIHSCYSGAMRRPPRGLPSHKALRAGIVCHEASGGEPNEWTAVIGLVLARLDDAGLVPTWELLARWFMADLWADLPRYRHVLVDEGQDATPAECRFAARLLAEDGTLYVVADHRQSIMGWRGADPTGWGKPTHRLTRTFRFGARIAEEANRLGVGDPITGGSGLLTSLVFRELQLEDLGPLCNGNRLPAWSTAILCRTHADCEAIEHLFPEQVRHVQRDPRDGLSSPADRLAEATAGGRVPVTTVHGFKGREADQVIVIGASTIPWGLASDDPEERRVLYVAMTRARRQLILVSGMPDIPGWRVRADGLGGAA